MPLKCNGKPFSLHQPSPTALKIKAFLDKSPKDEVFTADGIAEKAGMSRNAFRSRAVAEKELEGYTLLSGRYRYWGHPSAIKELTKQLEAGQ